MNHGGVILLRIFLFTGSILSIILALLLRGVSDRNYRLGNKSIARFEAFLSFFVIFVAFCACVFLYYLDSAIPSF